MIQKSTNLFTLPILFVLAIAPIVLFAYEYGPDAGYTGAPGDNATGCIASGCHTGTLNSGTGSVRIIASGGTTYVPGVTQQVQVAITDAAKKKYGFELSARVDSSPNTMQAGLLTSGSDGLTQVICADGSTVPATGCAARNFGPLEWIEHTLAGYNKSGTPPGYTYTFSWTPPATNVGPVTLYAAGNAVTGTFVTTGSNTYLGSLRLTPVGAILTTSPTPSAFGQKVTLTGTVAPLSATGNMRFYDGETLLGTQTLVGGHASLTTSLLAAGTHSLTVYYTGDSNNAAGASAPVNQKVIAAPTSGYPTAVNYPTANRPYAVVIGDFNSDGVDDIVTADHSSANISVLLGNGDGTFKSAVIYPVGLNPIAIATGDFNADGKTDLVVVNNSSNTVSLLLGKGDGTFQVATSLFVSISPTSVVVADFNHDGNLDMAVANQRDDSVSVLLGDGSGTFSKRTNPPTGVQLPSALAVGDFNNDGRPDLVVTSLIPICPSNCTASTYLVVLPGNGDGTFQSPIPNTGPQCPTICNSVQLSWPSAAVVGDFNGDGNADVAVADQSLGVVVFLGNGNGTFPLPTAYPPAGEGVSSVAIGDFNGDGKLDLAVVAMQSDNLAILFGKGDGTFQLQSRYPTGMQPTSIAVGDFNGDARPDLVTANQNGANISILLGAAPILPSVFIDTPLSGAAISGTVNITGWALDTFSTGTDIASVVVMLDGAVLGNATYGISRPDVCAAYPGRPRCPNVGYAYQLNTNGLSSGLHTITVSATDTDGVPDTGSATITVTASNIPPLVSIDSPLAGSVLSGTATVSGWAIDNGSTIGTAITSVQIKVDGTLVGTAAYGSNRPDVCAAYPGRPGCPNVGFVYLLNTTTLSAGTHVIIVSAMDADGIADIGSKSVTISVSAAQPSVFIEAPTSGAAVSGVTGVVGWALDDSTAISSVVIKVDGNVVGNATYGINRPDICAANPGRPGCPNVGFSYGLDTTKLTAGMHTLTAVATDSDKSPDSGTWIVSFVVLTPPQVYIDSLAPGASVSGSVTVAGWAIDSAATIGSVRISVDGNFAGNAAYGTARPDVCAAYPGRPGCPNVGFTFQLNTASLSAGTHSITALATDTEGPPQSSSYTLTVTVQSTGTPPQLYIDSLASGVGVSGMVPVSGWAIDSAAAISSVQIKVDGAVMGTATYGTPRPDVCVVYPGRPGCPNVGFTFQLNTFLLTAGNHTLTATATDTRSPADVASFSIPIFVFALPTPPTLFIDTLTPFATVSGTVNVSGWAIDSSTAIGSVQILVDGAPVGTATYGIARPDVCAVYPGRPGCPNVGFTFQLNTASLTAGIHAITAVATDTDATPDSQDFSVAVRK